MYQSWVPGLGHTHRRVESEYLEEAEASGVEAVFPLAVLQGEELQQLHDELGVGEIFKDDLFTLSDTEKRRHASQSQMGAEECGRGRGLSTHLAHLVVLQVIFCAAGSCVDHHFSERSAETKEEAVIHRLKTPARRAGGRGREE